MKTSAALNKLKEQLAFQYLFNNYHFQWVELMQIAEKSKTCFNASRFFQLAFKRYRAQKKLHYRTLIFQNE